MQTEIIDTAKEVFNTVSDKEDFKDAPKGKNYVSRMMWWNYFLMFAFFAMLVWAFFFSIPKSSVQQYVDDVKEAKIREVAAIHQKDSVQREMNALLWRWVPQAKQNSEEVEQLRRGMDSLKSIVETQNVIVKEYNRSFEKIKK